MWCHKTAIDWSPVNNNAEVNGLWEFHLFSLCFNQVRVCNKLIFWSFVGLSDSQIVFILCHSWKSLVNCLICGKKLDESTARRQLKSPRSLSGRSIHLTLVTEWSQSWSWMTYCHTLCALSIGPPILRYSYFKIWPWKSMIKVMCVVKGQGHVWPSNFKGQDYGQGQTHWSHLRPGVQSMCLLFVS